MHFWVLEKSLGKLEQHSVLKFAMKDSKKGLYVIENSDPICRVLPFSFLVIEK